MAEPVSVDARHLQKIVRELGEEAAERIITRTLHQVLMSVQMLCRFAKTDAVEETVSQAERLSRLSRQVGLVSLAAVAGETAICARSGDRVAIAALAGRVERVANRSLNEIWDGVC
ncbi:hypothetical protein [Paracoccus sp. SCSIO 75233]|uniref:hypothetical protein n=1 Tax=Paracoccus sp. SCSIO 75233 TaxID=3017782 RepID=UPI0022F06ED0|nr:hypothetical protein [Paracoccus sp. SCSIO 75233]WBU53428.1 hypothetical protein PAF12_00895 [Paracoccus sp. SCSIO 75233]